VKRRSIVAITLATVFLLTRLADVVVTQKYDPYLELEGNPVVSILKGGWGELLAVNTLLCLIVITGIVHWWRSPLVRQLPVVDQGVWSFASNSYFQTEYSRLEFLLRTLIQFPRKFGHLGPLCGFVMPLLVGAITLLSTINWYVLRELDQAWYQRFYSYAFPVYPFVIPAAPLYLVFLLMYYRFEWREACRLTFSA
jgi:hypothetical protein